MSSCGACIDGIAPPFPFTMAFQPVIDLEQRSVFAYEALVRGPGGTSAGAVLAQVTPENRYSFDQSCRIKAIELAARLGLPATGAALSINFLPNAVYEPAACIQATLKAAHATGFPVDRIMFEVTEAEHVGDTDHLKSILDEYHHQGFITAIDDFGAGYAGLNLLAEFQPDILKIDMALTRGIEASPVRHAIVEGVVGICRRLGIRVIAEGIETAAELACLRALGVTLVQGYLFARPEVERLPEPRFV
jgi:EAL domain-containing protein (putative c-di-GMP-specific phosphodiesterase class I)